MIPNLWARLNAEKSWGQKTGQKWILRGFKLRGLTLNQINTPYLIYEIDQGKQLNILDDFENKTPTHMSVTHVI